MVLGVLKDQKDGKAIIMSMKYLCTILAPYELRNAMQMIHMLEGMLVVSVSQQLLNIAKVSLNSKVTLDYNLPIHIYICMYVCITYIQVCVSHDVLIVFLLKQALIRWQADIFGQP
jgi:hypothetical protein